MGLTALQLHPMQSSTVEDAGTEPHSLQHCRAQRCTAGAQSTAPGSTSAQLKLPVS